MKRNSALTLTELVIMLLIFALAAALSLRVFAAADSLSRRSAARDEAVLLAGNAAELLRHTAGDYGQTAELLGGVCQEGEITLSAHGLTLTASPTPSGHPLLGQGEIEVRDEAGELIFSLTVCWQEVTEDG